MTQRSRVHRDHLRRFGWAAAFAGGVLAIAGCQSGDLHGEDFAADNAPRDTGTILQNQAAASAATESALQEQDFASNTLNSLGQVQLDLMVKGTPPAQPLIVHMDFPQSVDDETLTAREASASEYLQDRGVPKADIQFVEGANAGKLTPTAASLPLVYRGGDGPNITAIPADEGGGTAAAH